MPRPALTGTSLVDCDYTHGCINCKNCYLAFWCYFSQDSQYDFALLLSRNTYDSYTTDNSDHAYETMHSNRLYRVRFGCFSDECLDSAFIYNCIGCNDCFGCVNLRKQKYRLWNEQLSKPEYLKQMEYWDLGSYQRLEEAKAKFRSLYLSMPHKYAHALNSNNVSGDIIRDTKDCQTCFSALDGVQNCKYLYFGGLGLKDSYDVTAGGNMSELMYETIMTFQAQKAFFSSGGSNLRNAEYSDWVGNSSDVFGCVSLKNKKHCILNKQYTKDEYQALVPKIKQQMHAMPYVDKLGRKYAYGDFFPAELSAYSYNETQAFTWYPKTKEEVIRDGLKWRDLPEHDTQITIPPEDLPDHIRNVEDSILQETIGCLHGGTCNEQCTKGFRLTSAELAFYRDMKIALPRLCPNCRHYQRFSWRNGFHLWDRNCMCGHEDHFHTEQPCPNKFSTTFSPEKPEIIYCDQCFKAEFL